jgi:hypothetical protein
MSAKQQKCPVCKQPVNGHSSFELTEVTATVRVGDITMRRTAKVGKRTVYFPCKHTVEERTAQS